MEQAGLSLHERAVIFNNKFCAVKISGAKLYKIYKAHGIKYKKVKTTKVSNPKRVAAIKRRKDVVH